MLLTLPTCQYVNKKSYCSSMQDVCHYEPAKPATQVFYSSAVGDLKYQSQGKKFESYREHLEFFFSKHAWVIRSITTLIFHPVAEFTSPFSLTALHWKLFCNMANLKKLAKCAFDFAATLHSPAEVPFFPRCKLCLFDSSSTVPRHDHKCLFSNKGVRWEEIPKF